MAPALPTTFEHAVNNSLIRSDPLKFRWERRRISLKELWLSTNDNPANKVKIGSVLDYTDSRQWNKYSTQKSPAITLTQGQQYYVEALQKEAGGGDNLAVGWAKPGEPTSAPSEVIPASALSPY